MTGINSHFNTSVNSFLLAVETWRNVRNNEPKEVESRFNLWMAEDIPIPNLFFAYLTEETTSDASKTRI